MQGQVHTVLIKTGGIPNFYKYNDFTFYLLLVVNGIICNVQ